MHINEKIHLFIHSFRKKVEFQYLAIISFFSCSLIENSAQLETVESLQELAVKSPYGVDCTWSSEAESLREIAVKTPDKLTEAFILKFFKSLRIVDKKVVTSCLVI